MPIIKLDDATINRIAAGEVIENPASVVKELVENAIDANASFVLVEIELGGLKCIRVSDNGDGMSSQDARLSLQRHATSKIVHADDIVTLDTMGFRGEALASIAAVSHFKLLTCRQDEAVAALISCSGGRNVQVADGAREKGTTIEARQLFHNTPARLKFQKTPTACANAVLQMLTDIALAHPDVKLKLCVDGDRRLVSGEVASLLGSEVVNQMLPIDYHEDNWSLKGCLGKPHAARSSRKGQFTVVNHRTVHSPFIAKAVEQAYGTRLSTREYPLFILTLELPGDQVDVNVHPQKKEVRFQNKERLQTFIKRAVQSAFEIKPKQPHVKPEKWSVPISAAKQESFVVAEPDLPLQQIPIIGIKSPYVFLSAEGSPLSSHLKEREGIVMVNLRSVEQRVLYERMKPEKNALQQLMTPVTIELSAHEATEITKQLDHLTKLGVGVRMFGVASCVVDRLHPALSVDKIENIIKQSAHVPLTEEMIVIASVKNHHYTISESHALIKELLTCRDVTTTPSGKSIFVHLDEKDIERLFKTH